MTSENPMIAFKGVRSSCDILARNLVLPYRMPAPEASLGSHESPQFPPAACRGPAQGLDRADRALSRTENNSAPAAIRLSVASPGSLLVLGAKCSRAHEYAYMVKSRLPRSGSAGPSAP